MEGKQQNGDILALQRWREKILGEGCLLEALTTAFGPDLEAIQKHYTEVLIPKTVEEGLRQRLGLLTEEGQGISLSFRFKEENNHIHCEVETKNEGFRTLFKMASTKGFKIPAGVIDPHLETLALACMEQTILQRFKLDPWLIPMTGYGINASSKICVDENVWAWRLEMVVYTLPGLGTYWNSQTVSIPWERRLDVPFIIQEFSKLKVSGRRAA